MSKGKPLVTQRSLLIVLGVVLAVVCLSLPYIASAYVVRLVFLLYMWVALASSWNLISGYTGYVSFGHAGFFGVGAYAAAILITRLAWEWWLACLLAGLLCIALGAAIGWPALRLRGPYFAITMLGLSELARIVVTAWDSVTRGGLGVYLPIVRDQPPPTYYGMLVLAVVAVVVGPAARRAFRIVAVLRLVAGAGTVFRPAARSRTPPVAPRFERRRGDGLGDRPRRNGGSRRRSSEGTRSARVHRDRERDREGEAGESG